MNPLVSQPLAIRDAPFSAIAALHARIPEFAPAPGAPDDTAQNIAQDTEWFASRCRGKDSLTLVAAMGGNDAGYMVSYDKFGDGSFYCWMTGILPDFRRRGLLTALMERTKAEALVSGYDSIRIKTRNGRREMLSWLVAHGFDFLSVDKREPLRDSRIELILSLDSARKGGRA